MADAIEARCQTGAALVKELRAYAAVTPGRGQKGTGFCRVDPATGRDRRHRAGNRPKAAKCVEVPAVTDAPREDI